MKKPPERYQRQELFFGKEGQAHIASASVAIVGVGGLGTQAVQQLALLGVGHLALIDGQELAETNRNRYIGVRTDDPVPGFLKVDLGERIVREINKATNVTKLADSFVSYSGFSAIKATDYVFGCLDSEGGRLVLNEFCGAYEKPYLDLASDIIPGTSIQYGGRIHVNWTGDSCLMCSGLIDVNEAQSDLAGPAGAREREAIYGIERHLLDHSGPSVVSINGVVASLGVTEFMVGITGVRTPRPLLMYYGANGKVTTPTDPPMPDCYYCKSVRGKGDGAGLQRYLEAGLGQFLK